VDIEQQLVEVKMSELVRRFSAPQWRGPHLRTPAESAALQAENNLPIEPHWQICLQQAAPDSRDPRITRGGIEAAVAFSSLDDLLQSPVELIAKQLAMAIAGRAAHEALEWVRLDGQLVVDPHGAGEVLDEAADKIREYMGNAAE
jgi:hypothetical protein